MLNRLSKYISSNPIGQIFNLGEKTVAWKKVTDLKPGMKIAIADSGVDFDEIVSIKAVGQEQVYDIEVENTHNFVGNGILAHNTLIAGNVTPEATGTRDIGTSSLYWNNLYVNNIISGGTTAGFWQRNSGAMAPSNLTDDLLLGTTATSSAKFAFKNIASGTPTASISGNSAGRAISIDGLGNITTTAKQSLTLGDSSTGNIILNAGNVGIGTTAPGRLLDVNGITRHRDLVYFGSADEKGTLTWSASGFNIIAGNSLPLTLGSSGTADKVTIDTSGQVGIGRTSPSTTLDVAGSATISATLSLAPYTQGAAGTCNAAAAGKMYYDGTGGSYYYCNGTSWTQIGAGAAVQYFDQQNGLLYPMNSTVDFSLGGQSTASAKFVLKNINSGTPTASISGNSAGRALSIDGLGNITTTVKQSLTLGDSSTGNIILNAGNVGIGTTAPSEKLDVAGNIKVDTNKIKFSDVLLKSGVAAGFITVRDLADSAYGGFQGATGAFYTNTWTPLLNYSTGLTIRNQTSGNITIDAGSVGTTNIINGNVGIGTTGPTTKLEIGDGTAQIVERINTLNTQYAGLRLDHAGTEKWFLGFAALSNDNFIFRGAGTTNVMAITTGGNVGIGDVSPATGFVVGSDTAISISNQAGNAYFQNNIEVDGTTTLGNIAYTWPGTQGSNYVLTTNGSGTLTWNDVSSLGASTDFWNQNNGLLFPKNSTVDFSIGGQSTASAKFAFTNINSGTPTLYLANQATAIDLKATTVNALDIESGLLSFDTNSSYIGIGDTTPSYKLDVNGRINAVGDADTNTPDILLNGAGGIGYTAGQVRFYGPSNTLKMMLDDNIFDVYNIPLAVTDGSWVNKAYLSTVDSYFNGSGNVGVGNASPNYKLDVTGTASVSADMLIGGQTQLGRFGANPAGIGKGGLIYNTATDKVYYYNGTTWNQLADSGGSNPWTDGGAYLYATNYESLRVYDSGGTDYMDLSHDGTNAVFTSANTTKYTFDKWIDITGALTASGNLDINGTANDIAGTLNLSGNTLTSASDLTLNAGGTKTIISDDLQVSGGDILGASGNIRITVVDALQRTDITGLLSADRGATFSAAIAADTPLTLNNNSGALIYKVSNAGLVTSGVTDSSTAIAFNLDTSNTLSTQGSKLLSLKNNSTEKFYIDSSGNLYTAGTIISGNGMGQLFTNKSGGTVTNRSLVTLDTSNNSSFTTTTIPYSRASYGVLIGVGLGTSNDVNSNGACDANDVCMIAQAGEVEVLLTNAASAVRGDYIFTSATAGSGISSAKQFDGLIGIVSNTSGAGSGYVKMIFKVQPQISGSPFLNTSNTAVTDGSYLEIIHNSGSSVTMAEGWRYNTATAKYELIDVKDDALATGSAQVNFNTEGNYTQENMAYAVTLTPSATSGDITLTLGSGTWNADARVTVGTRVTGNGGIATITGTPAAQTTITATVTTAFTNTNAISSGSWYLYGTTFDGSVAKINTLNSNFANLILQTTSNKSSFVGSGNHAGIQPLFDSNTTTTLQFDDTGNTAGTNYIIFQMTSPIVVTNVDYTDRRSSGYNYTGTVRISGSTDNVSYTTLMTNSNTTANDVHTYLGPFSIANTTAWTYFKLELYSNTRTTYESIQELGMNGIVVSTVYSVSTAGDQISTTSWSDINDVDVTETLNSQTIYYSVSFDGRTTFYIYDATTSNNGWRPIVRNNASTWQYNSNTTAGVDKVTWTNATYNSQNGALSQAYGVTVNQMSGTTLGALTDLNWNEINGYTPTTNTLDFSAGFKSSVSSQNPQVDGINVKYTKAGYKIVEVDSNTSRLYNYSGATQNLKFGVIPQGGGGSPGAGNGLWTNNNASVANGSYIEVAHNQSTNDLVTNGWIYDGAKWVAIDDAAKTDHNTQDPKLLSWYKMEEASGDLDNAQGTAARDLIDLNAPTYQASGKVNKAITFDGTNDYFCTGSGTTCADADTLDFAAADSFTLGGWFKHDTIATNPDYMVAKRPNSAFTVDTNGTLGTSLNGYWKLDETSGTRVDSASTNDLTDNNTVTSATGKQGNAGQFTRANAESLSISDNTSLSTGDIDFSIAGWVYMDSKGTAGNDRVLFGKLSSSPQYEYYVGYNTSADRIQFAVSNNGSALTTVNANNLGSPSLSTWYFVSAWHDSVANTINISVNNGTTDSTAHTTGVYDSTAGFRIGGIDVATNEWDGRIDEVGFWKKVLTAQERTDLYNSGNANTCTDDCNDLGGGYKLYMESDGDLTFGIDDDGTSFPEDSATTTVATYDDNAWHHVAAVKNGTTNIKLYIDGQEVASDTSISATGTLANAGPFYLGIDSDATSNPWAGSLDEMFAYSRALTAGEIGELYRSTKRYAIEQTDANTVRLYNYSGSTQNLRLDVITGGLGRNSGTVSLAPAAADTDSQASTNTIWINKTGLDGSLLKLQKSGSDIFNISQAGGNAALVLDQRLGGDIFTASASGSTKFTIANSGAVTSGVNDAAVGEGTGGTITRSSGYTIHTFTSGGTFTPPAGVTSVEYLVVGGGGGGGGGISGGGGGGGFRTGTGLSVTAGTPYTVTVGAGGTGGTYDTTSGTNGGDSVFSTITSTGGGKGSSSSGAAGSTGGSGGGGNGGGATAGGAGNTPSTSPSQGNNGGNGVALAGGGGGGSGAVGSNADGTNGGSGGSGTASSISGTSVTYAGGGGGGANTGGVGGGGGSGGGGAGGPPNTIGTAGTANTGGGGGGSGRTYAGAGPSGGSGVVIVRYLSQPITDVLTLDHTHSGTAANGIGTGILFRAEDTGGSIENAGRISGILANATDGYEQSALTFDTRGITYGSDIGAFSTTSQGQLPAINSFGYSISATVGGTSFLYAIGGCTTNCGSYVSTVYKSTIDSSGNAGTFATTSQSQLPATLGEMTIQNSTIGGTQYIYIVGGYNGSAGVSTVYKSTIDSSGNAGTFATTSQSQLPATNYSPALVIASIGGTDYLYVIGGFSGTSQSTVYKATIDTSGNVGTFATTSQAQLPAIRYTPEAVTASIGGTQYLYVIGGDGSSNGSGTFVSTVYKATIDSSGNVGTFSTTSQGQLPTNLGHTNVLIVGIGGTQYLYVMGGKTPTVVSTVYKATIDSSGNVGTFSTTSQGQLPQALRSASAINASVGGTQYLYHLGGNTGSNDVSTVYKATIGPDTGSSTLTRRMKLDHAGNLTISGTLTQSGSPDIAENVRVSDSSIEGGDVVMIDSSVIPDSIGDPALDSRLRGNDNEDIYNRFVAKKADQPYSKQILGVISSDPGIVLNSSKNVVYDGLKSQTNERALAIAGRVPVKIDPDSAAFDAGDPLTASTKPGLAQKATKSGYVIGKSLESWTSCSSVIPSSPSVIPAEAGIHLDIDSRLRGNDMGNGNDNTTCGRDKILTLIQYGYVDQQLVLDENKNLDVQFTITPLPIASDSASLDTRYLLLDSLGQAVNQIGVFSDAAIANMKVGLVAADKITAKTITIEDLLISPIADIDLLRVKNLIAENATVSGTLIAERLVSPTLDQINDQLSLVTSQYASASSIISSIQAKYTNFGAINNATTSGDPLDTTHLYQENATIADLNVTGAIFADSLNSNSDTLFVQPLGTGSINLLAGLMTLTPDGNVTINGNLNVTGSVLARDITSGKSNVDQLSANKLSLNDLTITTASATESASVGFSTIASSSAEIFIPNSKVSENTLIYVTPIGNTNNQVLYVKEKVDGLGFTVAVPSTPSSDLRFNYWLIKTQ